MNTAPEQFEHEVNEMRRRSRQKNLFAALRLGTQLGVGGVVGGLTFLIFGEILAVAAAIGAVALVVAIQNSRK